MADVSDHQSTPNGVSDQETRWKGKYFTLLKHCRLMEQVVNQLIIDICLTHDQLRAVDGSTCLILLWQRGCKFPRGFFFPTDRHSFHSIILFMERLQNHRFKNEAYLFSFHLIKHVCTETVWRTQLSLRRTSGGLTCYGARLP